jgi:hypothetical protein
MDSIDLLVSGLPFGKSWIKICFAELTAHSFVEMIAAIAAYILMIAIANDLLKGCKAQCFRQSRCQVTDHASAEIAQQVTPP